MRVLQAATFAFCAIAPVALPGAAMLTPSACALLATAPVTAAAEYAPGRDARGRRVVPADVDTPYRSEPLPTVIDLTTPVRDPEDGDARRREVEGDIPVARVYLDREGRARFAGELRVEDGTRSATKVCRTKFEQS